MKVQRHVVQQQHHQKLTNQVGVSKLGQWHFHDWLTTSTSPYLRIIIAASYQIGIVILAGKGPTVIIIVLQNY